MGFSSDVTPGHSLAIMKMKILEKDKKKDEIYRKKHEHYFVRNFNTYFYREGLWILAIVAF